MKPSKIVLAHFLTLAFLALAAPPARSQCRMALLDGPDGQQWPNQALVLEDDTLVVGSLGEARVYVRDGETWNEQALLQPTGAIHSAWFGSSLDLEGDKLVVGNPSENSGDGAFYVYARSGTAWSLEQRIGDLATIGYSAGLGTSVSLSGNTLIASEPYQGGQPGGNLRVYTWDNTSWTQQAKLVPMAKVDDDGFGYCAVLQGDTILCGAHGASNGAGFGVVYTFERSGTVWSETKVHVPSDPDRSHYYGRSLSFDGTTMVVGATNWTSSQVGPGCAYIYQRTGSTWVEQDLVTPALSFSGDRFGAGTSLHQGRVMIGATGTAGVPGGRAHLFELLSGTWTETNAWELDYVLPLPRRFANSVAVHGSVAAASDQAGRVPIYKLDPGSACASARNGPNNPDAFLAGPPRVGTLWSTTVIVISVPGATATWIMGYAGPSAPIAQPYGDVLVDLTSPRLFVSLSGVAFGISVHDMPIPNDPALVGAFASAQAAIYAPPIVQLGNAVDLTIGL